MALKMSLEKEVSVYGILKKCILLIMLLMLSHSPTPLILYALLSPYHPPTLPPPLSSSPQVVHISSSASPFSILFLTTPCLYCTYHLCFLFPVPFPYSSPSPSPLITLYVISISVSLFLFQVFAQFAFAFVFLGSVVDSSEFVVI